LEFLISGIVRKKNHYTHARGKLLGVHIGVYQPRYSVLIINTWYK